MRLRPLEMYLTGAALGALLVGGSLASAGARPINHPFIQPMSRVQQGARVAPGRLGEMAAHRIAMHNFRQSWIRPNAGRGCIYLSDNTSGEVLIYNSTAPYAEVGELDSPSNVYGWGLADTTANVYVGNHNDTIDLYAQCKGKTVVKTLTGGGAGSPYGMWAGEDGSLLATEFPTNAIDAWGPAPGYAHLGSAPDNNMALPYFIFYDPCDAKPTCSTKAEPTRIIIVGNSNGSPVHEQVDTCTMTTGPLAFACKTLIANAGSFPGGAVGLEISGKYHKGVPNLIVNDQTGILTAYACNLDIAVPACDPPTGSYTYNNGTNPLDYTAIDLDSAGANLWGANIFLCSSNNGVCGDGQSQSLPIGAGTVLNGNTTPAVYNAQPLGITISPPYKKT